METIKWELEPEFDGRKSFYKKAHVIEREGGRVELQSYDTIVATIEDGKAKVHGFYSPTTLRHIKEFLYQFGFKVGSKAELEKMYT